MANADRLKKELLDKLPELMVRHRVENDLTQAEFAEKCGLSAPSLSGIENGRIEATRDMLAAIIKEIV